MDTLRGYGGLWVAGRAGSALPLVWLVAINQSVAVGRDLVMVGRSATIFLKKGLGKRAKVPKRVHVELVTRSNSSSANFSSTGPERYCVGPASRSALESNYTIKGGPWTRA